MSCCVATSTDELLLVPPVSVLRHVCCRQRRSAAEAWQQWEAGPNGKSVSRPNRCPWEEIRRRERWVCMNRKWKLMCFTSIYLASCPSGGRRVLTADNMETKSCSCSAHKDPSVPATPNSSLTSRLPVLFVSWKRLWVNSVHSVPWGGWFLWRQTQVVMRPWRLHGVFCINYKDLT